MASWLVGAAAREFVLGDLVEQYDAEVERRGRVRATLWYARQLAGLVRHRPGGRPIGRPAAGHAQGDGIMQVWMQDVRQAVRQLMRQPSYTLVGLLSLALAVGANGLVYGMVDTLVLNPFQFPDAGRLVSIGTAFPRLDVPEGFVEQHSPAEVADFRAAESFDHLAAFDIGNRALSSGTSAQRVLTALLLDDPLPALARPPLLGRGFTRDELAPGGPPVAMISHRVWRDLFGEDPSVVGRLVQVNSEPRTVVGVMDPGTLLLGTDLWVPWGGDSGQVPRNRRQFTIVARLAPGVSVERANAELATIAGRTASQFGGEFPEYQGWRARVATWTEAVTGQTRGLVALLLGAGVLVLLIACANLSSLTLARLSARRREIAVRYALGAGGWQVTRLLLVESLLLSSVAAALGIALARLAMSGLPSLLPDQVVRTLAAPSLNARAVAYSVAAALLAAAVTTILPAWRARRASPRSALSETTAGAGGGRQRLRRALVVAEVTLAVVLLVGAGQMLFSFARLQNTDPGFRIDGVMTMRLTLASEKYGQGERATQFFNTLVDRLGALPGVTAAAATSQFPPNENFRISFRVEGVTAPGDTIPTAFVTTVTPGYFDVLGIPLRAGRMLDGRDRRGAPVAVVVNEAFMRRYLDGRPGGRLLVGPDEEVGEVVGVVADSRNGSMLQAPQPEMFVTIDQIGRGNQYFVLARTDGDPTTLVDPIQRTLSGLDPDQPLYLVQPMSRAVAGSLFPQRVALLLVGIFAVGATLVAAIGVYGVVAFFVASRTREIGIRLALGATRSAVTRVVVGHTAWLVVAGAGLGLGGGVLAARSAGALLYESARVDPLAIGAVVAALVIVGLAAGWFPARRAMRLDPAAVLRSE